MTAPQDRADRHLRCHWCREPAMAEPIATFFVAQADPAYISHSELQFGRATAPGRWAEDLHATVRQEAQRAIMRMSDEAPLSGTRLAVLSRDDALLGMAFVSFQDTARRPFAILDDLLIGGQARGEGAGQRLLDWIASQCRTAGFSRLFLESGIGNARAHHFFERHGFAQTSIVMMRAL